MKTFIQAQWVVLLGKWNHKAGEFTEVIEKESIRTLTMRIDVRSNGRQVLIFDGGPTGYESYYVDDLKQSLADFPSDTFCICAGTVNSWPRCTVNKSDVLSFLAGGAS